MSAPRFLLAAPALDAASVRLAGPDAHHARVLRLQPGDAVRICDGRGLEKAGRIQRVTREAFEVALGAELRRDPAPALRVTLFQGLAKGDKLDWTLQKATELGLHRFVPMTTARSQVHPDAGSGRRTARWQEIARQAVRQSEQTFVPEVAAVATFAQALAEARSLDLALLPYERAEPSQSLKTRIAQRPRPASAGLLVGPEGGFTAEEVAQAEAAGAVTVGLGPNVLRSETAGLVAVALVCFAWGDLGGGA